MESYQVTIGINEQQKIEFQGIRNTYPVGEPIICHFTIPATYIPEMNDYIGIFPVGWTSVKQYITRKQVKPEQIWSTPSGQYGKVEFEYEQIPRPSEQYYQFIYIRNGEQVRGASTPFMFVPTMFEQQQEQQESIFGGRQYLPEFVLSQQQPTEWKYMQQPQQQQKTLEQVVEREMQKLQNGLFGLEQGMFGYKNVFPTVEETLTGVQQPTTPYIQQQQPFTTTFATLPEMIYGEPQTIRKHWQARLGEVQQMLSEQVKIEQAHRRLEQLNLLAQLKQYERHIVQVQKREQEIREYLRAKMQKQVVEFEQKVQQVMKIQCNLEQQQQQQPAEHYIRRYEQLLKEKIELDIQKRLVILHKLRQTVRECERKLREVQQSELQHQQRFHQQLKNKLAQFETKCLLQQIQQQQPFSEKVDVELREQLKYQISQFLNEQRKEQYQFIKAQKQLVCLVNEICGKLQDLEMQEVYAQLRIPRVVAWGQQSPIMTNTTVATNGLWYQHEQYLQQVQQLEQQLVELKSTLRMKLFQQSARQLNQQFINGEWIKPVAQKLRELEWQLRQQQQYQQQYEQLSSEIVSPMPVRGLWFERRLQNLNQHLKYFERQLEQQQQYRQPMTPVQEEVRLREVLGQLRELEAELCEYPLFLQQQQQQQYKQQLPLFYQQQQKQQQQQWRQMVEFTQQLQQLVREKVQLLSGMYEQSPIECFIQTGNHQSWKQMMQYERKLVQLKGMLVEKQQYHQLQSRLIDLEQLLKECQQQQQQQQLAGSWFGKQHQQQQLQKCVEQIKYLRQALEQQQVQQHYHQHQSSVYFGCQHPTTLLLTAPEQYIQQQQKYERLWHLINELECQLVEQQVKIQKQQQQQQSVEQQVYESERLRQLVGGIIPSQVQQFTLGLIQQRFERLVFEVQRQMPELIVVSPKFEQIVAYVRQQQQQEPIQQQQKPYYGQQLKEKIIELEQVLVEQEVEKQCWSTTTVGYQQPSTLMIKQIIKQCRELKQQIQPICDDWVVVVSGVNGDLLEQDINNNSSLSCVGEPLDILAEVSLTDLLNAAVRQQQQQQQQEQTIYEEFIPRYTQQQPKQWTGECGLEYLNKKVAQQQIEKKIEQFERQMQNIEQLICTAQQQQQQQQQEQQFQQQLFTPVTGLRSSQSVENLIQDLETELVKLRVQQREYPYPTTTARLVLSGTPVESVCDEIGKFVSQNLLTTVIPTGSSQSTTIKVTGQEKTLTTATGIQQQQQQQTQTTTVSVEPLQTTPIVQCIKIQKQQETTQQQF